MRWALALAAGFAVWALGSFISTRPFIALFVSALPSLAALAGRASGLLFFSGSASVLVFSVACGVALRNVQIRLPRAPYLFVGAFLFFVIVGARIPGPAGPQGDEPHYLLIAKSLLDDGDTDLANQYANRDYSEFTSATLEPHRAPRSPTGTSYSVHTPGLAALIAPGYALAGYRGARAVLSFVVALACVLTVFAVRTRFDERAATWTAILLVTSTPLPVYANAIYPDSVATLPVAATLAWLARPQRSFFVLAAFSIAFLPWLHPRFLPLAATLVSAMVWFATPQTRLRIGLGALLPTLVTTVTLLRHFHAIFGVASFSAAYGPGFEGDVSLASIPRGIAALLLDRQFGLLLFAPVLLFALVGASIQWKADRARAAWEVAIAASVISVGAAFSMWWAGASPPARFTIGATPVLALLVAPIVATRARAVVAGLIGFGIGVLALACMAPRALHNRPDGDSGLLRLVAPTLNGDQLLPTFVPSAMRDDARPLVDSFASTLRLLDSWNENRVRFRGDERIETFSLEIPSGTDDFQVDGSVADTSPRFSLPQGRWQLEVEYDAVATPNASNTAVISLIRDDESQIVSLQLGAPASHQTTAFDIGEERRVRMRLQGVQSKTILRRAVLRPTSF